MNAARNKSKPQTVLRIVKDLLPTRATLATLSSESAELAVLGSVLDKPDVYHAARAIISAEDFFTRHNGLIWYACQQVIERGEELDFVTLFAELQKPPYAGLYQTTEQPDAEARFHQFVAKVISQNALASNVESYARIIKDRAIRVRMIDALNKAEGEVLNLSTPLEETIGKVDALLFTATQRSAFIPTDAASIASEYHDSMLEMMHGGQSQVIPLGFKAHDETAGGLTRGEVTILAGSAGMGKTSLLLSAIYHIVQQQKRVILFSVEMSRHELMNKFVTMLTGIPSKALQMGTLPPAQQGKWLEALATISNWQLDIVDEFAALTPAQFRARALKIMHQHEVDLIAIDGLWLMAADAETDTRHEAVNQITKQLAEFAKQQHIALLLLHQYKQDIGMRSDKTPKLGDLSESAGVQRNSHYVLGIHNPHYYNTGDVDQTTLHVLKARNKDIPIGEHWALYFDPERRLYLGGTINYVDLTDV